MDPGLIYADCNEDCSCCQYMLLCVLPIPCKCVLFMVEVQELELSNKTVLMYR